MKYYFLLQDKRKIAVLKSSDRDFDIPLLAFEKVDENELIDIIQYNFGLNVILSKVDAVDKDTTFVHADVHNLENQVQDFLKWLTINDLLNSNVLQDPNLAFISTYLQNNFKPSNVKLQFGLQNNIIVHISEIPTEQRGLKCECVCPLCKQTLQARIGSGKRAPHFAHSKNPCDVLKANETALHLLAKEILLEAKKVKLPSVLVTSDDLPDEIPFIYDREIYEELQAPIKKISKQMYEFDDYLLETKVGRIIPDLIVWTAGYEDRKLMIEVAVTHFIDEEKEQVIVEKEHPCIEIDLSKFHMESFSREELKKELLYKVSNKRWIYNKYFKAGIEEMRVRNEKLLEAYYLQKEVAEQARKEKEVKQLLKSQAKEQQIFFSLEEENYTTLVTSLRNDTAVFENFKNRVFFSETSHAFPYFLDIPVTGQIAFNCDRRIWQMELFEKIIYTSRYPTISIKWAWDWFTKYRGKRLINWDLVSKLPFSIGNIDYIDNLAMDAIKRYLSYLGLLGFIEVDSSMNYYKRMPVISGTIIPPNVEFSNHFQYGLRTIDDTPLVDSDIHNFLF